ncbi:hypothetical protein [Pantanalinema sp. GBBB05]|uniref:hypothetical protein n=1 Tax=Pantanalinema sp. GBBB05 TaxID=2604139 RepID=UPI003D81423B
MLISKLIIGVLDGQSVMTDVAIDNCKLKLGAPVLVAIVTRSHLILNCKKVT